MHSDNIPDRVDTDNSVIRRERRAIIDGIQLAVEEVDTQVIAAGCHIAAGGTAPFVVEAAIERVGCGLGVGYTPTSTMRTPSVILCERLPERCEVRMENEAVEPTVWAMLKTFWRLQLFIRASRC